MGEAEVTRFLAFLIAGIVGCLTAFCGPAHADPAERALAARCGPLGVKFIAPVRAAARRHLLHPALLVAVMWGESRCRMDLVGRHGEVCAFQLHGAARNGCSTSALSKPSVCVSAAARWLALMEAWCGSILEGLGAYNTGMCPSLAERRGLLAKARAGRRYARRVLRWMEDR